MSKKKAGRNSNIDHKVRKEVRRSQVTLVIAETASVVNTLIRWGCPCAAAVWCTFYLAGKNTNTNLKLEGILNAFANQWIYLTIAGLCGGGWFIERRALRRRVKELAEEKKSLEAAIDPDRSSSGLDEHGSPSQPSI